MQLKDVSIYKEDNLYYMKLIYNYTDDKGNEHCIVFPKVCFPTELYDIPTIEQNRFKIIDNSCFEIIDNSCYLYLGTDKLFAACDIVDTPERTFNGVAFADWITKHATYDMTLEEIENKLGHKVKIVSEKEKSTNNERKINDENNHT